MPDETPPIDTSAFAAIPETTYDDFRTVAQESRTHRDTAPADDVPASVESEPVITQDAAKTPNAAATDAVNPIEPAATDDEATAVKSPVAEAAVPATDAQKAALQAACDALGIAETDPVLQAEALLAVSAERTETQKRLTEETAVQRLAAAKSEWGKKADKATETVVLQQMQNEGWDLSDPHWHDPAKATDPETAHFANARFYEIKDSEIYKTYHGKVFGEAEAAYTQAQSQIDGVMDKFKHGSKTLLDGMRSSGLYTPDQIENVARMTDEDTRRTIAMTNSALTRAKSEVESLTAQVSGHEKALKAARDEGKKEALAELNAGRNLPNTNGLGNTSEAPLGLKGVFDSTPEEWSMDHMQRAMAQRH